MKWTDLIIAGIITHLILKDANQSNPRPVTESHYFGPAGTNSLANQFATQPQNRATPFGITDIEIKEIFQKAVKEASQETVLPAILVPAPKTEPAQPDKNTIETSKWLEIIKHPSEVVILGRRGSGKSCLAYRIAEHLRGVDPVYVVAFPDAAKKYLPGWIGVVATLEGLPDDSIAIVDEAYILYHARSSMTAEAKEMSRLINLSRQKNQTIIFVSQESKQIDRNILSGADVIVFKEPSMLQTRFDRAELHAIAEAANQAFQNIAGDRRRWSYITTQGRGDIGLVESSLPTFWTNQLSRAFSCSGESTPHPAKQLTLSDRIARAKEYHQQKLSLAQIGKRLGVSKATVKNYLDGYPYKK